MSLRDSVTKKAFVEAINDANGTRIRVNQIDLTGVDASGGSTRNSKVHTKASSIVGNTVEGKADFNYNRVDLKTLEGSLSTFLPARPLTKVSDALEEINRNCKLNLEISDIVDGDINLNGEDGEMFVLRCTTSSPKYTGSLTFTLTARSGYLIRGKLSVTENTVYRVFGTTATVKFTDHLYAYLLINGVHHPIALDGSFTTQVPTGVWDVYYASPSLGTVGTTLPFIEVNRIVAYGGRPLPKSLFMYSPSLVTIGDDLFVGNTQPIDAYRMFFQCRKLANVGTGFASHASGFSSLYQTFSHCDVLATFGETDNPQADHPTTTIAGIFNSCPKLTNVPKGLFKGLARVTDASNAFTMTGAQTKDGCILPEGLLDEMPLLTLASFIFDHCRAISWPANLFEKQTRLSNVHSAFAYANLPFIPDGIFANCSDFISATAVFQGTRPTRVGARLFPEGAAVSAASIFSNTAIENIDKDVFAGAMLSNIDSGFANGAVTDNFPNLLAGQVKLTSLFNVFANAQIRLAEENAALFADQRAVTTINKLFNGTRFSGGSLPAGIFDNMVNITNATACFQSASGLGAKLRIPNGLFTNQHLLADCSNLFTGAKNIEFVGNVLPKNGAARILYNTFGGTDATDFPSSLLDYAENVTDASRLFEGCVVSEMPSGILDSLVSVVTVDGMFGNVTNLKTLPASSFKAFGNVTSASEMFLNIKQIFIIPEGLFDPMVKLENIRYLFRYAAGVKLPKGLFAKLTSLTVAYSIFERVPLTGTVENMFHPELYKNKPSLSGFFYNLQLGGTDFGKVVSNIPLTGNMATFLGNVKGLELTVDQLTTALGVSTDNKFEVSTAVTNTNLFLLNALWLTGSRDELIKKLWGVDNVNDVSAAVVNNALSGAINLT